MTQIVIRNSSNVAFGLGVLIILIVGVLAAIDMRALIESNSRVGHTLIVLSTLDETLTLIIGAESGQRGFIITGDERFLEPHNIAIAPNDGISRRLQELRQLTSDNPEQQQRLDRLDSLVVEKLAFIQETIDLRRNAGFEAAQEALLTDKGRQAMDDIRQVIAEMQNEERALLQTRSDAASANLQNTLFSLTSGAGVSISLLLLSFYVVNREVGERRRAEEALQQLNDELDQRVEQRTAELATASERYINTLDKILEGCQIIGFDWRYLYVNNAVARQGRRTREELVGHTMMEMYPGIENTELFTILRRCMGERVPFHWDNEFTYPDGSTGWFELSVQPVPEGIFILSLDISERKQAEEALIASEAGYRTLFESNPHPMWVYDLETLRFLAVNDAAVEHYGYSLNEFLSMTIKEIRPAEDVPALMANLGEVQQDFHTPTTWRHEKKDGTVIDVEISSHVIGWKERPARLVLANDITERKRAERQIQQQLERLTALSKIDQAIISSSDLNVTLDILLSQVISQLQVDAANVLLVIPAGQMLDYAVGRGFRTNAVETTSVHLADIQAVTERRSIFVKSLKHKPDKRLLTPLGTSEGFVCYFGVPLIVKGKVKGVLEIFHRAPLQPDPEWLDFLNTLAGQAAIAIENATLFQNLERSNQELSHAYDATIEGWSRALDLRDKETEGHTQRVTEMTITLARAFGFPEEELFYIRWGALLHDIGKMGVPDNILLKPGALTPEEWEIMRRHPEFAYSMLAPITYLRRALDIPYYHHEKWDGTGYPHSLRGEAIPLAARLFAVVDVWDALRSDRPYRPAWTQEKTLEHIQSLSGTHFDPKVVEYFLEVVK